MALVLALAACGGGSSGGSIIGGDGPQLSVTVSGSGTVGAAGTDITCSSGTCSGNVPSGTAVTLTATAASGYQFDGWGGACSSSGTSTSCALTISADTTVTATFSQVAANSSALTVSKAGSGTVTSSPAGINCGSDCGETYTNGTTVTLTATPASGYTFQGWSGPCTGQGTCVVSMSQARVVSATFSGSGTGGSGCSLTRASGTSPTYTSTHPRILLNHAATKTCLQTLMNTGVTSATRFKNNVVDRQMSEGNVYDFQPWYAALMYQVTNDARYATYAIEQTDAFVASEEALINANQRATVAADSYLEVGPKIGGLALVYDWTYDRLTPTQRSRWIAYANQAVWNVWNHTQAKWGNTTYEWSGWSVDNPSNNYYYSFLKATMLLGLATRGENSQAQAWIDKFRTEKIENQLIPTFNRDLEGGGSREGTGYGVAMKGLWMLYDWWERSTGERIATRTTHTLASIAHMMHSIVPTLDRLAPTGDHARDASAALFDYHREYLLELIALFPQERLSGAAKSLLDASSVPQMTQQFEYHIDYLYEPPQLSATALTDLSTTYYGPGTGQLMMRSAWNTGATFSNFICGPYSESHAHHDQGSFVLYRGGWLAYDANIDSSSGIEQGEEMHNLVRITSGGSTVPQREGAPKCNLLALADNGPSSPTQWPM
ncbi:MAG: alginate lyase family protein [Piscinibacter sp.]